MRTANEATHAIVRLLRMTLPTPAQRSEAREPSGFTITVINDSALARRRHWVTDEDRAHRFAQLESEEYGIAYITQTEWGDKPYPRLTAVYKRGVHLRVEPGQLWLRLAGRQEARA